MIKKLWKFIKPLFVGWTEDGMVFYLNSTGRWDCRKKKD